jgi:autotransporter-associated beta strand protein
MKNKLQYATSLVILSLMLPATADVIYSGYQGISIPTNWTGVTVTVAGGSINPFFGGLDIANDPAFQPVRTGIGGMDTIRNLAAGTLVDASSLYFSSGDGGSSTHVGTTFVDGSEGNLGMKLSGSDYGWMRVVLTNNTSTPVVPVIKDWAYDNTPGAAIVVGNIVQSAPSAGAQAVTLTSGTGKSFTLGTQITNSLGNTGGVTNSVIKEGAGTATLTGTNPYSGTTAITAGKLVVGGSIGSSAVTVSNAGSILASGATGTIGNSVVISNGAILAAGDAGAAGEATVTTSTTFNNGSIFSWDIDAVGTSYDKLVSASLVDGDAAGGAVLRIVASDALIAQNFWDTGKTWDDIFTTDSSSAIGNWANIFTSVTVVNSSFGSITPVGGAFSASGSTLTWTVVPEPTAALVGVLLASGMLRRRRNSKAPVTPASDAGDRTKRGCQQ